MGKYSVYQEGQTAKLVWLFFFLNWLIIYLVIWGCAGSSLLYSGFLWFWRARATLRCSAWASRCCGFSCCQAQALGVQLNSFGMQALLLQSMWDLAEPGIKPMCPALAGGFLTTGPPGKSMSFWWTHNIFPYFNEVGFQGSISLKLLSEARSPRHRFLPEFNDSHKDRWPVEDGLDSDN